jgi:hypothetical protein
MRRRKLLVISAVLLVLIFSAGAIWVFNYYKPTSEATEAMKSNDKVQVTTDKYITFTPKNKQADTGFIFYPGGKVDEEAYAPLCQKIAEGGYTVVVVPMPLKLAVLGSGKAEGVIEKYPEIKSWAIGGHSLGGVMAATFANKHQTDIKGLVFFAAYPQDKDNISKSNIKVLSLRGTKDGLVDKSKIENSKKLVPEDSIFYSIEGGNHCGFGTYGFQKGDNKADISGEEQQNIAANYTIKLLEQISK